MPTPHASVAPKERVNIAYQAAIGDARQEKELPLKLLVLGDFTGRNSDRALEERTPVPIAKDSFDDVLASLGVSIDLRVRDRLSAAADKELAVTIDVATLKDFEPEAIARHVPAVAQLLVLRQALCALKGPLGNVPAFKKKILELVADGSSRTALLGEIRGIDA